MSSSFLTMRFFVFFLVFFVVALAVDAGTASPVGVETTDWTASALLPAGRLQASARDRVLRPLLQLLLQLGPRGSLVGSLV